MNNVHIKEVRAKKEFKKFLSFPWKIYKNDPNWVTPLLADMKEKLDKKKKERFIIK